jgi:hypothetical protein
VFELLQKEPIGAYSHECQGTPDGVGYAWRHYASELPALHTSDDFNFRPHYDAGAGRYFGSRGEYAAWQKSQEHADGSVPEPMEGKRANAFYEEGLHACHINKQVEVDEKAEKEAFRKAWDESERDLRKCDALGVKPPGLDD